MRRIESKLTHVHPRAQTVNRSHRQYPLTPPDTKLKRVCSVGVNQFGSEGAKHFADMLKVNTALISVK